MATPGEDDAYEALGGPPYPGMQPPHQDDVCEDKLSSRLVMFCDDPPCIEKKDGVCVEEHDGASACVSMECLWQGRQLLKVFFMNSEHLKKWKYQGKEITTDMILEWANVWNPKNDEKIPSFVEAKSARRSEIRVKFSDMDNCWSKMGAWAEKVSDSNPTMTLNLGEKFSPEDKRSLVIHEFGHALGLEHEHQRSDFWDGVEPHIDMQRMKDDPRVKQSVTKKVASFGKGWLAPSGGFTIPSWLRISPKSKEHKSEYDSQSIMHYGFDIDWLKNPVYRDRRKVGALSEKELPARKYLLGLHERQSGLAKDPSELDLKTLQAAYYKVNK